MDSKKYARVLFVEDSKNEYHLNLMILRRENTEVKMDHVRDGIEAVEYLERKNKYKNITEYPDLILLDQRLITMDGDQVLKHIQRDKKLKQIPVVMFSGVISEDDSEQYTELGAVAFFDKPINLDKLTQVVNKIEHLHFVSEGGKKYLCKK
ncbi:MAG: response regulator [Rickettsiales bacterium]